MNFVFTPLQGWWSARQTQIHDLRAKVAEGKQLIRREASIRSHWDDMRSNALSAKTSEAEHKVLTAH